MIYYIYVSWPLFLLTFDRCFKVRLYFAISFWKSKYICLNNDFVCLFVIVVKPSCSCVHCSQPTTFYTIAKTFKKSTSPDYKTLSVTNITKAYDVIQSGCIWDIQYYIDIAVKLISRKYLRPCLIFYLSTAQFSLDCLS